MKRILGLDLGTNSIGWSLLESDFDNKKGRIIGAGVRIIPMSQDVLGKFDAGQSISQTAERTGYRSTRRLYQRNKLRRERLHRILNILGFLPSHYANAIDFEKRLGQFLLGQEVKLNYRKMEKGYEFIFQESFLEMAQNFKDRSYDGPLPYDWTIYYLRQKALSKKISKEELAWIILNFNQKRGYYQLRGEDEDSSKNKQFVQLKVQDVIDTGEKVKGNTRYSVTFANGWKYDKPITKKEDWIGREKEFIVTTKELKSGEIKYSFKAVNSEEDWAAIKAKTEQEIEQSKLTVGQFIYQTLLEKPQTKIRGKLVKTIERKYYKQELHQILEEQIKYHQELADSDLFSVCITHLYSKNKAHRNRLFGKGFVHLFIEDIIFYQRPLKSKKSSISGCRYEFRSFDFINKDRIKERKKEYIKAIPKSHPLFQEFRLWQFCNNIRIYDASKLQSASKREEADVTRDFISSETDCAALFDHLNNRAEVDQKNVLDFLLKRKLNVKKVAKAEFEKYLWNYDSEKKYPCNETKNLIESRLSKIESTNAKDFLTKEKEVAIWHIIYSVRDKKEYERALNSFAKKNEINSEAFVEHFKKIPPFSSDYGSYSYKAIKKLLPLMRTGKYWDKNAIDEVTEKRIAKLLSGEFDSKIRDRVREKAIHLNDIEDFKQLPLWLASYVVYNRHSESSDIAQWSSPDDIESWLKQFRQHSLRNPIVEKVVLEALRVVKDIWTHFGDGQKNYFDEIHLELGREMKNSAKKRESISKRNTENENTNQRIRELLVELMNDPETEGQVKPYSPSQQEILKIYEEGVYSNPKKMFTTISEDEVDKIRKKNSPTHSDIEKYKLWLKQGYKSPYTGQIIPLSKLFTHEYEIEHIIPKSRYFDNSLSNKVICETNINADKGNKTAYEYIKSKDNPDRDKGTIVGEYSLLSLSEYEDNCKAYFNNKKSKLRNLLSEDIPEGFINRQMNDSRYISKYVKGILSNIVREDNEKEATSKNLIPMPGAITSKLKRDWGLNDKWNEIVASRFQRLNNVYDTKDFGAWDKSINAFRTDVPSNLKKGFSKKRIDHRHHALDAIVIACCTRDHINYINALNNEKVKYALVKKLRKQEAVNIKNPKTGEVKKVMVAKQYLHPWTNFTVDAKKAIENIVISFKSNNRLINKTNNKTWQWVEKEGVLKKVRIRQVKGDNWAIRKPLHKETVSGIVQNIKAPKGKVATASRTPLSDIKNAKHIDKITDESIRKILNNHLENYLDDKGNHNFQDAFSESGIEDLNKNIKQLNGGKDHMPIFKVRQYEVGSKFSVGTKGNNKSKFVETAKGTNLFFAIYLDEKKNKRVFETIPLNEVIEHQKQVAHLPRKERLEIQPKPEMGKFLFSLSPNDLVFVPNEEESNNPNLVDFKNLNLNQLKRIYKMVSCTGNQCFFAPISTSIEIVKNENGTNSKNERVQLFMNEDDVLDEKGKGVMIKNVCWKLDVNRLGNLKLASPKEHNKS